MADVLTIRCRENGPLVVQGTVRVVDHLGNEFTLPVGKDKLALCRCGHSKTRSFCDSSHQECRFQAPELAPPVPGGEIATQPHP